MKMLTTNSVTDPVQYSSNRPGLRAFPIRTTLIAAVTAGSLFIGSSGAWASPQGISPETIPNQSDSQAAANASDIAAQAASLSEEEQAELVADIDAQHGLGASNQESPSVDRQAVPVVLVITCVGSIGLSVYQGYQGGDPVEFIASAVIGCLPFGAASKPAVMGVIKANKGAIIRGLKAVGVSGALLTALEGDS